MDQPGPDAVELTFKNGNRAIRTKARLDDDLKALAGRLGLGSESKPVIVVCGGANKTTDPFDTPEGVALGRAVSQAAEASGAIVIDGGTRAGVMKVVGNARASKPEAMPVLVGVAPCGKVTEPGQQTQKGRTELEWHHSHFVLVNGDDWGDETDVLFSLAATLSRAHDVVVVLAGGGTNAKAEADEARRRRWPLIVMPGFGGIADKVAFGDETVRKIVKYDQLGVVKQGVPGQLADWLIWELAKPSVLKHAWRLYAAFDGRARRLQNLYRLLELAIIVLGVALTALAVVFTAVSGDWQDAMQWATIVLPSVIAFLVAWGGRRAFGKRWVLLRAVAEAVRSETFRYRTLWRPYHDPHGREEVLSRRLALITGQLSSTEAETAPLSTPTEPGPPRDVVYDDLRDLSPMGYVQRRVDDQCAYYHRTVRKKSWWRNALQIVTLAMGGLGTILAAVNLEPWVAVTAAVATGAAAYLTSRQHEQDVVDYNAAAADLDAVRLTWFAADDREDPEAFETLVTSTEAILTEEVGAWARRMAKVLNEQERERKPA